MSFNEIQKIKRQFFALRNGVTADALRKGGSPFNIIFGLTIPQLSEIAKNIGYDKKIGKELWKNSSTRCSMLLAPMLFNPEELSFDEAIEMANETPCSEVSDILCLKLLSRTLFVEKLIDHLIVGSEKERYIALRLIQRSLRTNPKCLSQWYICVEDHLDSQSTTLQNIARQIINNLGN